MSQNLSQASALVEVPPLNSQKNQIQALVGDIDEILSKPSPRLPWMASVETVHQRQVLERIRSYLSQQAAQVVASESLQQSDVNREAGTVGSDRTPKSTVSSDSGDREAAQEILQAVIGEMSYLRTNLTQPLQADIQALRQEQQALISEIKQLERQRQEQNSLAQQQANQQQIISEFLQVLMGRLQENLAREVAQALGNLEAQFLHNNLLEVGDVASPPQLVSGATANEANSTTAGQLPLLTPTQRLEQIRLLQAQSDRALMRLDSTLSVVFEALQSNLQTYQESLSQGLEKMHSLGQQGEAMFAALVNHLASQLGREASSYVQSSIPIANRETSARKAGPTIPLSTLPQNEVAVQKVTGRQQQERSPESESDLNDIGEAEKLPYPGTELSPQFTQLRHEREELRNSITQDSPLTPQENDFSSIESPSAEPLSEVMMAEGDDAEDLYDSLFTPEVEISQRAEEAVGSRGNVHTLSVFKSPAVKTTNFVSDPIPEPIVETTDTEDFVEDFLLESENFVSAPIPEPIVAAMDAEDYEFAIADSVDSSGMANADFAFAEEDLFAENVTELELEPPAPTTPPRGNRESSETLAALSNVFEDEPQMSAANAEPQTTIRQPEPPSPKTITELDAIADWNADVYIPASPDENLLPTETPLAEPEQALLLNANALQQLQADLFSLEGIESPNASQSSSVIVSEQFSFSDFSEVEAENPFIVSAEEEMTSLDDLFAEVLEMPVAAAQYPSQEEVAAEQFSPNDASNMTLEDILASLMEAEATPLNYPPRPDINSQKVATSGNVTRGLETPDREKKKVELFENEEEFDRTPEEDEESFSVSVPTLFAPPTGNISHSPIEPKSNWYLGIDFGTAMLKAALLNRESGEVYPIYWEVEGKNRESECFGIPSAICLSGEGGVKSVGYPELPADSGGFWVQNFKPYLKVSIPYIGANTGDLFEPILQISDRQRVSLGWLLHGLRSLLALLNPAVENSLSVRSRAVGLESSILDAALRQLGGVILGTPASWSDAYRHNLREAVLGAGLVTESSHIFVVEDAIATLLSELIPNLAAPESTIKKLNSKIAPGGTLIVNCGAATTELALVDLPENPENLTYSHFTCHSFAYAGNAFDQDIICQLLLTDESFGPLSQLPRAGYADVAARSQLQQRLQSQPLGQAFLAAAANLKTILQQQDRFNLEIGDRRWEVKRRDLESKVLVPFVQQLNREVNTMLSQSGMSPVAINQAICTGGSGSWPAIARWLRQKLPNAIVIHDREMDIASVSPASKSKTSRVACGLATLALYPQVLDAPRQQYSDRFLLWELMLAFGSKTLSINEIMQTLERRGINTRACQSRIQAILNNQLPAGLLPSEEDTLLLTEESRGNPELTIIKAAPLFELEGGEYRLNQQQAKYLREYLSRLMASSQQKLEEPLFQSLVRI
ncbi:MAG TPA: hypothetical protein VK211_12145 [Kamptonema sp.]|nr:hypothetical protein [Kamptonema sp.]